jgi:tetratricopeptide (TPR) repeat protein
MGRLFLFAVLAAALLPLSASSQNSPNSKRSTNRDDQVIVTAPEFRRPGPPPASASAAELERTGDELRTQKVFLDAIDYYQAADQKGGNRAVLHNKAGICFLMLARSRDARKEFERAIKLDAQYPEALNNLGAAYFQERNWGKSIKFYKKAIALRDDDASFHSNIGSAYFAKKDYVKASLEYMRALQLDPDIFEHRSSNGISAQMISPEQRARFDYVLARMYATQKNFDRALIYLRKAIEDGYSKISDVYTDQEFAVLRKDARFTQLMAAKPPSIADTQQP